jgi:hypothetical protein
MIGAVVSAESKSSVQTGKGLAMQLGLVQRLLQIIILISKL